MMQLKDYLLNWYDLHKRSLPWRESTDPYRVWLSEIMLQQTRAETVKPYYARFLERYPDVFALADADEDSILKLWEGLGYYSRARNLHKTAKIVADIGGCFPCSAQELKKLPGIGPYVAGAVASIAYGEAVPALDGNQMRVYSRVLAEERILKTPFDLYDQAMEWLSRERPGDHNQALMDLGSEICTAKKPRCDACPLRTLCQACMDGDPERYPLRPAPVGKPEETRSVFLVQTDAGIFIQKRRQKLLGGLYEFPSLDGHPSPADAKAALQTLGFENIVLIETLPDAKHVFTHRIWKMKGYLAQADAVPEGGCVVNAETIGQYAFPSALRVYREIAEELLNHKFD